MVVSFVCTSNPRDLHVRTHSFPTRRSSDLRPPMRYQAGCMRKPVTASITSYAFWRSTNAKNTGDIAPTSCRKVPKNSKCEVMRKNSDIKMRRSDEHTSELKSLMRISYAVFCLKTKTQTQTSNTYT